MKVWQVWDHDHDGSWVVATYDTEALAKDHAETFGLDVQSEDVLSVLTPEAADPVLRERREQERVAEREKARQQYEARAVREQQDAERRAALTIDQQRNPKLCRCRTFSASGYFITPHGHCEYCGGWTPEVFRASQGEAVLIAKIDELAVHDRVKMRAICGLLETESPR